MQFLSTIKQIYNLPLIEIKLDKSEAGLRLYKSFTALHPRFKIIRSKSIGVALIKLNDFKGHADYLASVSGKNSAAYFSRKAMRAGLTFDKFNPVENADLILEINQSAGERQGRLMDESYRIKINYPINYNNEYFAVFKDGKPVAYIWLVFAGELVLINRILGHNDFLDSGVMYFIVTESVKYIYENQKQSRFIMYDTFFGATEGLRLFKKRCGFKPFKVNWKPA